MAHQAVLVRESSPGIGDPESELSNINEIAREFEGEPFLGPNSIAISRSGGTLRLQQKRYSSLTAALGERLPSRSLEAVFT